MNKHYIISKRCYEYNDEGYDYTDGGIPIHVAENNQDAENWVKAQMVNDARNDQLYMLEGHYLEGNELESYIEKYGLDGLYITGRENKYAYIQVLPNFKNFSDDEILEFYDLIDMDDRYFITEL